MAAAASHVKTLVVRTREEISQRIRQRRKPARRNRGENSKILEGDPYQTNTYSAIGARKDPTVRIMRCRDSIYLHHKSLRIRPGQYTIWSHTTPRKRTREGSRIKK
jgi:hypothetical protein